MTHEKDKKRRDALKKKGGEIEALVLFKQGGGAEKHYGTPCRLFSFCCRRRNGDVSLA